MGWVALRVTSTPLSFSRAPQSAFKKVLAFGTNIYKGTYATFHAEEVAISRLKARPRNKAVKAVNVCVIKTSSSGQLGMSKPCSHCVQKLSAELPLKGYTLKWVYYTDSKGEIQREKFSDLVHGTCHVSSYYRFLNRVRD